MTEPNSTFDYNQIPLGFYDNITSKHRGMRSFWHNQKFRRVIDSFEGQQEAILDIGCFSGTFLSMIAPEQVAKQVGVDILKEQIDYANRSYGTAFRSFHLIGDLKEITVAEDGQFDCVTIIEVIEHLSAEEIADLIQLAYRKLKVGGKLIITTPNYASLWVVQEFILNRISDVKYQEQHITHFHYFNIEKKLTTIIPALPQMFSFDFKTTTHFVTPYIALLWYRLAEKISSAIPHRKWNFALGSLLLVELRKRA